jgi:pimeloyl-ACP methyl ester carboxylesterase
VYLAAFALDAGETVLSAVADGPTADGAGGPDLGAALVFADDQCTVDPQLAGEIFFNDLDSDAAAAAIAQLGPQPAVTFGQSPDGVAWRERPSTYVVCELDMAIPPDLQTQLATRATDVVSWPTGHSPFLSRPDLVAELLLRLSRS